MSSFDTNYHYMVPEFAKGQTFNLSSLKPVDEYREGKALGTLWRAFKPHFPVIAGPWRERGLRAAWVF
jgi:5-methyltetrahydropteroyltriglutamate--homocysteine methyltransferase